jgi:hypothetical protein
MTTRSLRVYYNRPPPTGGGLGVLISSPAGAPSTPIPTIPRALFTSLTLSTNSTYHRAVVHLAYNSVTHSLHYGSSFLPSTPGEFSAYSMSGPQDPLPLLWDPARRSVYGPLAQVKTCQSYLARVHQAHRASTPSEEFTTLVLLAKKYSFFTGGQYTP